MGKVQWEIPGETMLKEEIAEVDQVNEKLDLLGLSAMAPSPHLVSRSDLPVSHPSKLRRMIEHTLLKPEATPSEIEELCLEAKNYGFYGVCVQPIYVGMASRILKDTPCAVITVLGFPLGATLSSIKAAEARQVIQLGAREVDMVIPVGLLKGGDYAAVYEHISSVVATSPGKPVKVIIETALLSFEEKIAASLIAVRAGASFVKTSTGFAKGGATVEDVALLRRVVPDYVGIKAAGGIRDLKTALAMVENGADRLGCSSSISIIREALGNDPKTESVRARQGG